MEDELEKLIGQNVIYAIAEIVFEGAKKSRNTIEV